MKWWRKLLHSLGFFRPDPKCPSRCFDCGNLIIYSYFGAFHTDKPYVERKNEKVLG
jgi:hypothetical protein